MKKTIILLAFTLSGSILWGAQFGKSVTLSGSIGCGKCILKKSKSCELVFERMLQYNSTSPKHYFRYLCKENLASGKSLDSICDGKGMSKLTPVTLVGKFEGRVQGKQGLYGSRGIRTGGTHRLVISKITSKDFVYDQKVLEAEEKKKAEEKEKEDKKVK